MPEPASAILKLASASGPRRLRSLPPEVMVMIITYAAQPGALKYIMPFVTWGQWWFDLIIPFIWKRACIHAITHRYIESGRRVEYAKHIQTLVGSKTCRCVRCRARSDVRVTCVDPAGVKPSIKTGKRPMDWRSHLAIIKDLDFPRLRKLHQFRFGRNDKSAGPLLLILGDLARRANGICEITIDDWGSMTSHSLLDFLGEFGALTKLTVRHMRNVPGLTLRPSQAQWDHLVSAKVWCVVRTRCPWHSLATRLIDALAGCPNLKRLHINVPAEVGSLSSHETGQSSPRFPALEELVLNIRGHAKILHSLGGLRTLIKLSISMSLTSFNPSFIPQLSPLHRLKVLKIQALSGSTTLPYLHGTFSPLDLGLAIQHMADLRLLEFAFPPYDIMDDYVRSTHRLLQHVAEHNPELHTLILGHPLPVPLPVWNAPLIVPKLHSLHISSIMLQGTRQNDGRNDDISAYFLQLQALFPALRSITGTGEEQYTRDLLIQATGDGGI